MWRTHPNLNLIENFYTARKSLIWFRNQKVLLRERKRYTTRCVASAHFADLSPDRGGGTPSSPGLGGGIPSSSGGRVVPHPVLDGGGVPHPVLTGGTPCLDLGGGTPLSRLGWGTPQTLDRVPLPASVDRLKILPSLILRMRAVIIVKRNDQEWG